MNNGQGQPSQGQPQGGQPGQPQTMHLFKPGNMRNLPEPFTAAEKQKWEQGLTALWAQMEKFGPETTQHQDAKRKLFEFSKTLAQKLRDNANQKKAQANAQAQAQAQAQARYGAVPLSASNYPPEVITHLMSGRSH